jgi:hypothetical protein
MADTPQTDSTCGCCVPDRKSSLETIRELEARREALDVRLAEMGSR